MIESNDDRAAAFAAIDAAISNEKNWPEALEQIARFLGASFAALIYEDRASALLELQHSSRAHKSWLTEYLRNHRRLDAARAHLVDNIGAGRVFSSADFLAPKRFYQSSIFQRWLEPHDLVDIVGAILHRSDFGTCIFVAFRSTETGPVDENTKDRLQTLLPQLTEAASARKRADARAFRESRLFQLFEKLVAPVIIIDSHLRIKHANDSARVMLNEHPALVSANGFLSIGDCLAREALEKALQWEGPPATSCFAIMLRREEENCSVMHVLLLSHGEAAIIIRDLEPRIDGGGDAIANLYSLTARERSVLLAIADVGGVPTAARALGLTESTVKSYLKSIFQKTGAQRQADLVKLVIALESPFLTPKPKNVGDRSALLHET